MYASTGLLEAKGCGGGSGVALDIPGIWNKIPGQFDSFWVVCRIYGLALGILGLTLNFRREPFVSRSASGRREGSKSQRKVSESQRKVSAKSAQSQRKVSGPKPCK